jgi:D-lactate dehydrogenase (cytochrome)
MNADEHLGLAVAPTLFIEFHGATLGQLSEALETAEEICRAGECLEFRLGLGRAERDGIFKARHGLYEMIVRRHPNCRILVMDLAVPLSAYPELLTAMQAEIAASGLPGYVMSHAGNGNVHLDLIAPKNDAGLWELVQEVSGRLVLKAIALGGTSTGEHGVGLGKRKYMAAEHGKSLAWMRRVKRLFDPNGILNPGKIFPDG